MELICINLSWVWDCHIVNTIGVLSHWCIVILYLHNLIVETSPHFYIFGLYLTFHIYINQLMWYSNLINKMIRLIDIKRIKVLLHVFIPNVNKQQWMLRYHIQSFTNVSNVSCTCRAKQVASRGLPSTLMKPILMELSRKWLLFKMSHYALRKSISKQCFV
jgi:hypothetical protein